ncbi:MAG: HlyD family efflux transporter periplasmic adaptor subunit [Balneola sp.]
MLFPQEFIDRSLEHLLQRSTVRSQILYTSTLLFIISVFVALPFIYVNVGRTAQGLVIPSADRISIISSRTGLVNDVNISENVTVEKGQLLLAFQTESINHQLEKNKTDQTRTIKFISDLEVNIQALEQRKEPINLATPLYRSEWNFFFQQRNDLKHEISNQEQIYSRLKTLYEKKAISVTEFEQSKYKMEAQRQQLRLLTQNRLREWESVLNTLKKELQTLKTNEVELLDQQKSHYIFAPISGTLQNTVGISKNSVMYANQMLAEISPDTSLVAELYVTPNNIGLIQKETPIRFQIDAFNYNEWGFLEGTVAELPNDGIVNENGEVIFIVRCIFNQTQLTLPNGYSASIKKGMTLQGQFIIARRSLFQLLFDNVDDWLNPNRNNIAS